MKFQDESEKLVERIEEIQLRIEGKLDRRSTNGPGPNRGEALEELRVCVEELRVAGEEMRRQNELLLRERQRYLDLFNFAPDVYLVTDANGMIEEANLTAVRLLHCREDFLVGKPLVVFVAADEHAEFRGRLAAIRLQDAEKVEDWHITIQPRAGHAVPAVMTVGAIRDPVSRLTGLRWLIRSLPG